MSWIGSSKFSGRVILKRKKLYLAILSQLLVSNQLCASPEGGSIVGGNGEIISNGTDTTVIQQSDRMAINWDSYNLEVNERIEYIQPSSEALSLNRILSSQGSSIQGQIYANGIVILVNPHGIVFGKDAKVDAGSLLASGLTIDSNEFINGNISLSSIDTTNGIVINSGIINASTGGSVSLIGKRVENNGVIEAKLGTVNLAAGKEAIVTFRDNGILGIEVSKEILQDELGVSPAVLNSGEINADGGKILLSSSVSRNIFSQALNTKELDIATSVVVNEDGSFILGDGADTVNSGTLSVSSNESYDAGEIVLLGDNVTSSGEISADSNLSSGGSIELHSKNTTLLIDNSLTSAANVNAEIDASSGGQIKILGGNVGLTDNAKIDASGITAGGEILIGGDISGKNQNIRNAEFLHIGTDSEVKANSDGDGGKIIAFANNTARVHGSISATSGDQASNGGFVETSGLQGFEITSSPDVSANNGNGGTWLIDPYNITITDEDNNIDTSSTPIFSASGNFASISSSTINGALTGDVTVRIQTSRPNPDNSNETGDIKFEGNLNYASATGNNTLVLEAHGNIEVDNFSIINNADQDHLNIQLIADYEGSEGNISLANATIDTNGGFFEVSGVNFTSSAVSDSQAITTDGGSVNFNLSGDVLLGANITTSGGNVNIGNTNSLVKSFSNFENSKDAVINTRSSLGGGDISIYSEGSATLGTFFLGELDTDNTANTNLEADMLVEAGGTITLARNFLYRDFNTVNNDFVSNLTLKSGNSIIFSNAVMIDNLGGPTNDLNLTLEAAEDITIHGGGDDTRIWLGGGKFDATSKNLTLGSATVGGHLDSEGGNVLIDVTGAVKIYGLINTSGGDFTVGSRVLPSSFESYYAGNTPVIAKIDTSPVEGRVDTLDLDASGSIDINAAGDVSLGDLAIGSVGRGGLAGDVSITSGGDITLGHDFDFHDTGTGSSSDPAADPSFITLSLNATNDININGAIFDSLASNSDSPGDAVGNQDTLNVKIAAGGAVTLSNSIFTGGGNLTISGGSFDSSGYRLHTARSNPTQWGHTSTGGNIELDIAGDIKLGSIVSGFIGNSTGNLRLFSDGAIEDTTGEKIHVDGSTTINTDSLNNGIPRNVDLNAGHSFYGSIEIVSAGNVDINTDQDLLFNTSIIEGSLTANVAGQNNPIRQNGSLNVAGRALFTAGNDDITLANPLNNFSSVIIGDANNVHLADNDAVELGTLNTINSLTVSAGGTITDSDVNGEQLRVQGLTTIDAVDVNSVVYDITLDNLLNDFSTILAPNTRNLTLADANAISLGTSTISGALSVTANGTITDEGVLNISGSAAFNAGDNPIILDEANDFQAVSFIGSNVELNDQGANGITLGSPLINSSATSSLNVISNGVIDDAGLIEVSGTTLLSATAGQGLTYNIELDDNHDFSTIAIQSGNNVVLNDGTDGVILGPSTIRGNLTVTAAAEPNDGDLLDGIFQAGILSIDGNTILSADDNIDLNNRDNQFSTVSILTARGAEITNSNGLELGAITVTGDNSARRLNVVAPSISQSVGTTIASLNGGEVSLDATTTLSLSEINTQGANGQNSAGLSGGNVVLEGRDIIIGTINTSGGNAAGSGVFDGGVAGNIRINAAAESFNVGKSITLNGDLIAESGNATNGGIKHQDGDITLTLNNAGLDGRIELVGNSELISAITLQGSNDSDTLIAPTITSPTSAGNDWLISSSGFTLNGNVSFSGFETLHGGEGVDTFTIESRFRGEIFGNGGEDQFDISAEVTAGIQGGDEKDVFNIQASGLTMEINGGPSEEDQINLAVLNGDYLWQLDSSSSGTLDTNLQFSNIENIHGSDGGDDTFDFNFYAIQGDASSGIGTYQGIIDARGGVDTIDLTYASGDISLTFGEDINAVRNAEVIQGNGNDSSITIMGGAIAGSETTWLIDGNNSGAVSNGANSIGFIGFDQLVGNVANDSFTIESLGSITSIAGGLGSNSLTKADGQNTWTLTGDFQGTLNNISFFNISELYGGNNHDGLVAKSQENDWRISGAGSGTLSRTNDNSDLVSFEGFEQLTGGTANDNYRLLENGEIDVINGGAGLGIDTLTGLETNNTWGISALNSGSVKVTNGAAYIREFNNIESLVGSTTNNDIFSFTNNGSIQVIDGGAAALDIVDISRLTNSFPITISDNLTSGFRNIERYIGNRTGLTPSNIDATLSLDIDENADWQIYDFDLDGTLVDGINDGKVAGIEFINFNHLRGSFGDDSFTFGSSGVSGVTGTIDGRSQSSLDGDRIIGRNVESEWTITDTGTGSWNYQSGQANQAEIETQFSGIEGVKGSIDFIDIFDVTKFSSILLDAGDALGIQDELKLPDENVDITVGAATISGLSLTNFETITASPETGFQHTLRASDNNSASWLIDDRDSGQVTIENITTEFNNFQTLVGAPLQNDTFKFDENGSISTLVDGGTGSGINKIIGRDTNNDWVLNGTNQGAIRETGNNAFYLTNFKNINNLQGLDGIDKFMLNTQAEFDGDISGGLADDSLTVSTGDNIWRLTSSESGILNSSSEFSSIESLTGSVNQDIFVFQFDGKYSGEINAAGGSRDIVDVSGISDINVQIVGNLIHGIENAEQVIGDGQSSILTAPDIGTNEWQITNFDPNSTDARLDGINDGILENNTSPLPSIQFINFHRLIGGAESPDNFTIASNSSFTGVIDGGSGNGVNSVAIADGTNTWTITKNQTTAYSGTLNSHTFINIQSLLGGSGLDTLLGADQNNNWVVTDENTGYVHDASSAASNTISFSGIENLWGHQGEDHFTLTEDGRISGEIRGTSPTIKDGNNNDSLTIASFGGNIVQWSILEENQGGVQNRATYFDSLEALVGGDGLDIFDVRHDYSGQLHGEGGADTFNLYASVSDENDSTPDVTGGSQIDEFVIYDSAINTSIDGGINTDTLIIDHNTPSTWVLDGENNNVSNTSNSDIVQFKAIETIFASNSEDTFNISDGPLSIYGRDGDDIFNIVKENLDLDLFGGNNTDTIEVTHGVTNNWSINGNDSQLSNDTQILRVRFSEFEEALGGQGIDNFTIESSFTLVNGQGYSDNFRVSTAQDITINIVGGEVDDDGKDSLFGAQRSNDWDIGSTGLLNSTIRFSHIENLIGNSLADDFVITNSSLPGFIRGSETSVNDDILDSLTITSTADDIVEWHVTDNNTGTASSILDGFYDIERLIGGDGVDNIILDANIVQIESRGNKDSFKINSTNSLITQINAGNDEDTLYGANRENNWLIGSTNTINSTVNFTAFENYIGNQDVDHFVLEQGTIEGSVRGAKIGDTDSSIDSLTVSSNIADTVTWTVDTANSGSVNKIENGYFDIESLVGGDGIDIFEISADINQIAGGSNSDSFIINSDADLSTSIIGGDPTGQETDSLYAPNVENNWLIGTTNTLNGTINFAHIEQFFGNADKDKFIIEEAITTASVYGSEQGVNETALDSLHILSNAQDAVNWYVNSEYSGNVDGIIKGFANVENLIGSEGADHFTVRDTINNIDGGNNTDQLTIESSIADEISWVVTENNTGTVDKLSQGFNNIEYLQGGDGADNFTLQASIQTLDGNGNQDTLRVNSATESSIFWNITEEYGGTVDGVGDRFASIETLIGDQGKDFFNLGARISGIQGGENEDSLTVVSNPADEITWEITSDNAGQVDNIDNGFQSIENITGGAGVDTFNIQANITKINGGENSDIFIVNANDIITRIDGGSFEPSETDSLIGPERDNHWLIGSNNTLNDTIEFSNIENFTGNSFEDIFVIEANNINGNIRGITEGGEKLAADKLSILSEPGVTTQWHITGSDEGTVDGRISGLFIDIDTLLGGQGSDEFIVYQGGSVSGLIDGGTSQEPNTPAIDKLDTQKLDGGIAIQLIDSNAVSTADSSSDLLVSNLEYLIAAQDPDPTIDPDIESNNILSSALNGNYSWIIDGRNTGTIESTTGSTHESTIRFINFGTIFGGAGDDNFRIDDFGDISGIINGGVGTNFVDLSARRNDLAITLDGSLSPGISIVDVNGIIGNNDGSSDLLPNATLIAVEGQNDWTVLHDDSNPLSDGINDGYFEPLNRDRIAFINFNNLMGGDGQDSFKFERDGKLTGIIDGGSQANGTTDNIDASSIDYELVVQTNRHQSMVTDTDLNTVDIVNVERVSSNNLLSNTLIAPSSGDSNWSIDGTNKGRLNNEITFDGFENLVGGSGPDAFIFDGNDNVTGLLNGGLGLDIVNLSNLDTNTSSQVEVGQRNNGHLNIFQIEEVVGNNSGNNSLIADNLENTWLLTATDAGELQDSNASLQFSAFSYLQGGESNDAFTLSNKDNVSGIISGGAGNGIDQLNVMLDQDIVVSLGALSNTADIHIDEFEVVRAKNVEGQNNTLRGNDVANFWAVTEVNSGKLNSTDFYGFQNLQGGANDDSFIFSASGNITGFINGGMQEAVDTADYSLILNLDLLLGETGLQDIETLKGSGTAAILRASDTENTWHVDENGIGLFSSGDQLTQFTDFGILAGGASDDTFNIGNGLTISEIRGGLGDDIANIAVIPNKSGDIVFHGETGNDQIILSGGSENYNTDFVLADNQQNTPYRLSYSNDIGSEYNVAYSGVESIEDHVISNMLTVTASTDDIILGDNNFSVGSSIPVKYTNKENVTLISNDDLNIIIDGLITIDGTFRAENGTVTGINSDIVARAVQFSESTQVGSLDQPINVNTLDLFISNVAGDVFINEANGINLAELSTSGSFSLWANNDVTDSNILNSSAESSLNITTANGSITLDEGSALSGQLNLSAGDTITLSNSTATNLGMISASNLSIASGGSIEGQETLTVPGLTELTSSASISLSNSNNALNKVELLGATDVNIQNGQLLRLREATVGGAIVTNSEGIEVGTINAASVNIDASIHSAVLASTINTTDKIAVKANGIINNGQLSSNEVVLDGSEGIVSINNRITTGTGLGLKIEGSEISINESLDSGTDIIVNAALDVNQTTQFNSLADTVITAGGDIFMAETAATTGAVVSYTAANNLQVNAITAHDIELTASANINQNADVIAEGNISINSGQSYFMEDDTIIDSANDLSIYSANEITANRLTALNDISILTDVGSIALNEAITSTEGLIDISANSNLIFRGEINSPRTVTVRTTTGVIQQQADIITQSDIMLSAGSDITMTADSKSESLGGNIEYIASGDIDLAQLITGDSTSDEIRVINLNANGGQITDTNGDDINIFTDLFTAEASTGIGKADILETQVSGLNIGNGEGITDSNNAIQITNMMEESANSQDLLVERIHNNGDITLRATVGNIILDNSEDIAYNENATDAHSEGSVINANYNIGRVSITTDNGNLFATGPVDRTQPDIVAKEAYVTTIPYDIGEAKRQLVIFANDYLFFGGRRSWRPAWAFNRPPTEFDDTSTLQSDIVSLMQASGDQFVEVETLNEIDPAIFSNIRIFHHGDYSILLPEDQRYNLEEEQ